jgi:hypothetical protein
VSNVEETPPALPAAIDSQALIAYRLGRVEKAVESNNSSAIERDNMIINRLDSISTLSTQIATTAVRLENIESWQKSVNTFLIGLTLSVIGLIGTLVVKAIGI